LDPLLHYLQSEAERVTPPELLDLLQDFYRDTLALVLRRQANAQSVAAYDANNAYQQVLGRQDVHLRWLSDAIGDLGGSVAEAPNVEPVQASGKRKPLQHIVEEDAQAQRAFMDRWQPRVPSVTNARHRKMLQLILGEMAEHLRVFQQALEGRTDLLGRYPAGKVLSGGVLAERPKG
jgi:hypothetical protein